MVRVTIEILPGGDESKARKLGQVDIINDSSGTGETGNYTVRLHKSSEYAARPGIWRQGRISGFPRSRLGPYDLLYRALKAIVGGRN